MNLLNWLRSFFVDDYDLPLNQLWDVEVDCDVLRAYGYVVVWDLLELGVSDRMALLEACGIDVGLLDVVEDYVLHIA